MTSPSASSRLLAKLALIGLVCYGIFYRFAPHETNRVVVTAAIADEVVERQETLVGRALSESERETAVATYVDEELLVREGFRRGLDRGDRRIRPMLIDTARRRLLSASGYEAHTPSEGELESYFDEHVDDYRVPELIDLDQVLFLAGTAPEAPADVLTALREGADFTRLGAAGAGASAKALSRTRVAQAYGLGLASSVFALEDDEWHGPLASTVGTHFVRIGARSPARDPSYDEVRDYVRQDYDLDALSGAIAREMARVRKRYRVEVAGAQ